MAETFGPLFYLGLELKFKFVFKLREERKVE